MCLLAWLIVDCAGLASVTSTSVTSSSTSSSTSGDTSNDGSQEGTQIADWKLALIIVGCTIGALIIAALAFFFCKSEAPDATPIQQPTKKVDVLVKVVVSEEVDGHKDTGIPLMAKAEAVMDAVMGELDLNQQESEETLGFPTG